MNEPLFGTPAPLIGLLGGLGNVLAVTRTPAKGRVHVALAGPAPARPAELGDHRADHSLTATDNGFDLAVDRPNCAALIPSLLASANLLPELT